MSTATNPATVTPAGVTIDVPEGTAVMLAAIDAGFSWPTSCGGNAQCGTCVSQVTGGADNCVPMETEETETLERVLVGTPIADRRLACRLMITGPVQINKRGVRPVEG